MNLKLISLIVLSIALTGHFFSQKMLLNKGMESGDPKSFAKRLMMNGILLLVIAVVAFFRMDASLKMFSLLIIFEAVVCFFFSIKLIKRSR